MKILDSTCGSSMNNMDKIFDCIRQIEMLQDFIKVEFSKHKIDKDMASEVLRITDEIKEGLLQ